MRRLLVAAAMLTAAFAQQTGPPGQETLVFQIEHTGNVLPSFTLTAHQDGSAVYDVSYPAEKPKFSPYAAALNALPNTRVSMPIRLTPATTKRLFDQARSTAGFHAGCASKARNIADMGKKTLTYISPSGAIASCVYNYADDKTVVALTNTLAAIALTLDEGRKLEQNHRYDRLALDPETEYLVAEAKNGRATELAVIAPTLQALVDDPQVLERVRNRAANLLAQAAQESQVQ